MLAFEAHTYLVISAFRLHCFLSIISCIQHIPVRVYCYFNDPFSGNNASMIKPFNFWRCFLPSLTCKWWISLVMWGWVDRCQVNPFSSVGDLSDSFLLLFRICFDIFSYKISRICDTFHHMSWNSVLFSIIFKPQLPISWWVLLSLDLYSNRWMRTILTLSFSFNLIFSLCNYKKQLSFTVLISF